MIEEDLNVTDKRFLGNPTRSYRTRDPLRVIEEIVGLAPPPAELTRTMRQGMAELANLRIQGDERLTISLHGGLSSGPD